MVTPLVIAGHEFNANYPSVLCNRCGMRLKDITDGNPPEPCSAAPSPKQDASPKSDTDAIWRAIKASAGA